MKKLVLVAGLFIAFATNAQQRQDGFRNNQVELHQNQKDFGGLKLTPSQERKINALSRERLSQRDYEIHLKKILTREQYFKYTQQHGKDFNNGKKVAFNRSFRN